MDQTQFEVPDEFRHLGEFRQVFATTAGAMARSVFRSVIPLGVGCGLFALAAFWIVKPNWKYYLAILIGTLFTLQGVRLLARTLRRWNQKVLIFEKGIAISRLRELATYTWDRIEQVEAVVAQAQGAPSSFLSFSFQGRSKNGETRLYNFHPAGDPIPNLKGLWKIIDEEAGRARAASAIATVKAGEEVSFQRTIWGAIVSTQIGISDFGVRVKPRYNDARFVDWSRIEQISVVDQPTVPREQGYTTGGIPHLEITEKFHSDDPWVSELTSDIPGYQALIEAAQFAQRQYAETVEELERERLPAALALIAEGQEFALGKFGICRSGFRHEAETILWPDLGFLNFEKDFLVAPEMGDRTFVYDSLTLADRCLLQMVAQSAPYDHDYPDGDDEENDEEQLKDVSG
jgi:hypothetical protein